VELIGLCKDQYLATLEMCIQKAKPDIIFALTKEPLPDFISRIFERYNVKIRYLSAGEMENYGIG
jgi:hypothetical protein